MKFPPMFAAKLLISYCHSGNENKSTKPSNTNKLKYTIQIINKLIIIKL